MTLRLVLSLARVIQLISVEEVGLGFDGEKEGVGSWYTK